MWVWGPYYLKRFKISSSHVPNSPDGSPPTKKDYDVGDKELLAIKLWSKLNTPFLYGLITTI